MNSAETLIILILGAITYQLYQLLKIANKKTETVASEEYSTLYPVFTPREIQWQHYEEKQRQRFSEFNIKRLRELERKELIAHKEQGQIADTFEPSQNLRIAIESLAEDISARNHHRMYMRRMLEANVAVLNGASIKEAESEALKHSHLSMDKIEDDFKRDLTDRRKYWMSSFDTIVSDPEYAK